MTRSIPRDKTGHISRWPGVYPILMLHCPNERLLYIRTTINVYLCFCFKHVVLIEQPLRPAGIIADGVAYG